MRVVEDEFLSQTLALRSGRLERGGENGVRFGDFAFLYFRTERVDDEVFELQRSGFYFVETLVLCRKELEGGTIAPEELGVLTGGPAREYVDEAKGMWSLFSDFRFLRDPNLRERGGRVYSRWIENDFRGRADEVFVVSEEGRLAGFLLAFFKDGKGVVDLVGVSPSFRLPLRCERRSTSVRASAYAGIFLELGDQFGDRFDVIIRNGQNLPMKLRRQRY
jgi:hypothetical protein